MKTAYLFKTGGMILEIEPLNQKDFTLSECYNFLKCELIEVVNLSDGRIMIIDEEGKLKPNEINRRATILYQRDRQTNDMIVGDAIVCSSKLLK